MHQICRRMEFKCFAFTLLHFWNYLLMTNSRKYFSTVGTYEIYISKMNISEKNVVIRITLNISGNWYFYCITITSGKMFPDKQSPVIYIRCNFCKMHETWYLRCFDLDESTWWWLDKSMQLMKVLHYTTLLCKLGSFICFLGYWLKNNCIYL